MLDNWHRIERIIKWTGLSINAFAREIGLNRAENLYQIKAGNNGVSRNLIDSILGRYPGINRSWIMSGEGEMLASEHRSGLTDIPMYDMEISKCLKSRAYTSPEYYITLPMFIGSDFAAITMSDGMAPEIPPASVVILEEVDVESIIPGRAYYFVTERLSDIRNIRRQVGSSILRLVPVNTEKYDEVAIEITQIKKLFLIKGVIINKTL